MEIDKNVCPVVSVDGFIEKGKQFDMEIIVPEDVLWNTNLVW